MRFGVTQITRYFVETRLIASLQMNVYLLLHLFYLHPLAIGARVDGMAE
jgi:hypothetical protein